MRFTVATILLLLAHTSPMVIANEEYKQAAISPEAQIASVLETNQRSNPIPEPSGLIALTVAGLVILFRHRLAL